MRGPAVSFANKFLAAFMAALLTVALVPAIAFAEGEGDTVDAPAEEPQEASASQVDEGSGSIPAASPAEGGTLASVLVGAPTTFINSDVALDGDPVIGSFTVDGLTFAVTEGTGIELAGVSPNWKQVTNSQEEDGSPVAPMLASGHDADGLVLALPESVAYNDIDYAVTSIGAYAFYLSGVAAVELPASVGDVDDCAFRSSDVAAVEVADGNATYSSFDGALYDAAQLSLLLIPEGKQGTVLLPKTAESAAPSVFSHCPLVTQISVEEGSAAFASENGLLYDASLTKLLRVPAGATDIVIRDGCTTIAAGAMEACASLVTIAAPASVTSISPDVFTSVPTISLPAASAVADDPGASTGTTDGSSEQTGSTPDSDGASTQLTAMVALSTTDDDLPEVDPFSVNVALSESGSSVLWESYGFVAAAPTNADVDKGPVASIQAAATSNAIALSRTTVTTINSKAQYYCGVALGNASHHAGAFKGFTFAGGSLTWNSSYGYIVNYVPGYEVPDPWYWFMKGSRKARALCLGKLSASSVIYKNGKLPSSANQAIYLIFDFMVSLNDNGGAGGQGTFEAFAKTDNPCPASLICPVREDYVFNGYYQLVNGEKKFWYQGIADDGAKVLQYNGGSNIPSQLTSDIVLYADWLPAKYDISFDTSSEPGDEDYPGIEKPDETVDVDDGPTVIEDPKRPGYVFQGWVIPNAEGTEVIDQDLVYQDETDGKWYVDASKLPDYANDEGRVELTARWTSVISVDVPSAVTFYADVVTQGNESREGAASSAFGQNKVASQSEVDLRIVGLESTAVATEGSTLGADSILKKSASATPSSSTQKLFSLYPTDKALTPDDLQDPDAISQAKPADAVDFALDDLLLEKSFAADAFIIPAGDTLNLGYRLNLAETGTELDYDKLSALPDGASASIANISYCFAADLPAGPFPTGSKTDPLWVENANADWGPVGTYGLNDIKAAANDLSVNANDLEGSEYYSLYKSLLDNSAIFHLKVDGRYLDTLLLGIAQDTKTAGGKAGLTFQTKDVYANTNITNTAAGSGPFDSWMNSTNINSGGWEGSAMRERLRSTFRASLDEALQSAIAPVDKYQQLCSKETDPTTGTTLQKTTGETIWLPSQNEIFGAIASAANKSERLTTIDGYVPFQYQAYAGNGGSLTNAKALKTFNGAATFWWTRSVCWDTTYAFCTVRSTMNPSNGIASGDIGVAPCFAL